MVKKEQVAAAQELYGHMQNGTCFKWEEKERRIAGDQFKVSCVASLSAKAKILLANTRYVSTQQGGVQEVRTKIGNAYLEPVWYMASQFSLLSLRVVVIPFWSCDYHV